MASKHEQAALAGQHQLLGWARNPVMVFLVDANAAIDVDEYN
jgi:hypothetical protein